MCTLCSPLKLLAAPPDSGRRRASSSSWSPVCQSRPPGGAAAVAGSSWRCRSRSRARPTCTGRTTAPVQANLKHSRRANPKPAYGAGAHPAPPWLAPGVLDPADGHRSAPAPHHIACANRPSFIVLELVNIDRGVARATVATHMAVVCLLKSCCHSIGSV
jgi:hypothetical protein